MAIRDKSGANDKINLVVTGPDSYDGGDKPTEYTGNAIACHACGTVAIWDDGELGKGWRCPRGHLTRPGQ